MLNIINSPSNRSRAEQSTSPRISTSPRTPPPPPQVSSNEQRPPPAPRRAPPPPPSPTSMNFSNFNRRLNLASYSPTPFTYDEPPQRRDIDYLSNRREENLRRLRSSNTPSQDYYNYIASNGTTINRLARIQNRLNRDMKQTNIGNIPLSPRLIIKTKIVECAICQTKISKKNIVITKCDHAFCASCLFKNIRYNNKCPLCREVLTLPPVKKYHLSPEVIDHVIHQQITLHEDRLKNTISNFINEHTNHLNNDEEEPILDEDEIMDITVKILESMSVFSKGICRNIARRIETFNNANE